MENTGKKFAESIKIPDCPIHVSLSQSSYTSSKDQVQQIELKIKNTSGSEVTSQATNFKFSSGNDASCLFWDKLALVDGDDFSKAGQLKMYSTNTDARMLVTNIPSETSDKVMRTSITIEGPTVINETENTVTSYLKLVANEEITIKISGHIYSQEQKACSLDWSQFWEGDSWSEYYTVART